MMRIFEAIINTLRLAGLGLLVFMVAPQTTLADDLYLYGGGGGSFANGSSGGQNGGIASGPKGGDGNGSFGGGGGGIYIGSSLTDASGVTSGQDGASGGGPGQNYVEPGLGGRITIDIRADQFNGVTAGTSSAGGRAALATITFNDATYDNVTVRSGTNGSGSSAGRGTIFTLVGDLTTSNLAIYDYSSGSSNYNNTDSGGLNLKMVGSSANIVDYLDGVYTNLFSVGSLDVGDSSVTINDAGVTTSRLGTRDLRLGSGKLTVGRLSPATGTGITAQLTLYGIGAEIYTNYIGSINNQGYGVRVLSASLPDNYSGQAMLTLTGNTVFRVNNDTTVNIAMRGALAAAPGEKMTLVAGPIYNVSAVGQNISFQTNSAWGTGVTRELFDIEIIAGTNAAGTMTYNGSDGIYAYATGEKTYSDAALIYSESYLAGIFSLNSGMDLLQGLPGDIAHFWKTSRETQGLARSWLATGLTPFIKGEFSRLRHKTGSHVTHENYSMAVGASHAWDTGAGQFLLGGFLEGGDGVYDSYNSFTDPGFGLIGDVHGKGDTEYFGGGLILRHDFDLGVYAETSIRGGKVKHDFVTSDLYGALDTYDADTGYWGAHLGLGYKTDIYGVEDALDVYAKLLFTHQNGQDITNSATEKLSFDAVDSVRTRVGVKVSHQINDIVRGYAGSAFEHEFDSELTSRINGSEIETIGLKGHSFIGEVGVKLTPLSGIPFNVDVGAFFQGGERKGGGGSVAIRYDF